HAEESRMSANVQYRPNRLPHRLDAVAIIQENIEEGFLRSVVVGSFEKPVFSIHPDRLGGVPGGTAPEVNPEPLGADLAADERKHPCENLHRGRSELQGIRIRLE